MEKRGVSSWQGDIGFVVGAGRIFRLGGNQDEAGSIAVFVQKAFSVLRWPAEVPTPHRRPTTAGTHSGVREA